MEAIKIAIIHLGKVLHREWLIVWACVNSFGFILVIVQMILAWAEVKIKAIFVILQVVGLLWALFGLAWIIVGSVWLYTDHICQDCKGYLDFYDMWALTLAILIISYIGFGFAICGCFIVCCMACFGKGSMKNIFSKNKA